jgi:hypothetical protein
MSYQPKASMCMACTHLHESCTHLPFSAMPAVHTSKGQVIVRCTEFEPAGNREEVRDDY